MPPLHLWIHGCAELAQLLWLTYVVANRCPSYSTLGQQAPILRPHVADCAQAGQESVLSIAYKYG